MKDLDTSLGGQKVVRRQVRRARLWGLDPVRKSGGPRPIDVCVTHEEEYVGFCSEPPRPPLEVILCI